MDPHGLLTRQDLELSPSQSFQILPHQTIIEDQSKAMDANYYFETELEAAYSGSQVTLPYMFAFSGIALPVSLWIPYSWGAQLGAAGFVDVPEIPLVHFQSAVFVFVMLTSAYSVRKMPPTMPNNSRQLKQYAVAVTITMLLVWIGFASFFVSMCPGKTAVPVLAHQVDAVARYNRGYCEAWCRTDAAGLAALSRGDCVSSVNTIYDSIVTVGNDDIREWCQAAISTHNFVLSAPHNGASPFAELKGKDGCRVTDNVVTLTMGMLNLFATFFLYQFCTKYWQQETLAGDETSVPTTKFA